MRGNIARMALASLAFTAMMACVKGARNELPAIEVQLWRAVLGIPFVLPFALRGGLPTVLRVDRLVLRTVLGFLAMAATFTAAIGLPLADMSLLGRLQPLLVALLAPVILGSAERAPGSIFGLIGLGIAGSALLIGPSFAVGNVAGLYALLSTVLSALAHIELRALGRTERPEVVVLWFHVGTVGLAVLGIALWPGLELGLPSRHLFLPLLGTGLFAAIGQLLMTTAYQREKAADVAAASFFGPLWGAILDLAIWGVVPPPLAWAGGALILGSGLLLARRRAVPVEAEG
jgi:drug/metabolite transporter (DMT)-like permease